MPKKAKGEGDELVGFRRFGRAKGSLKMGVVGLPNVGKSSLFNLLTEQSVAAENYPFCTIEPTDARCPVPDVRFDWLVDLWKPPAGHALPAYLHVTDIAGLIKGASEGAGLGNAFLSNIIACDGVYHVIRAFDNDEVLHVDDSVDPVRDLETIHHELCAKDLQFVNQAIEAEASVVKKSRGVSYKTPEEFTSAFTKMKEMLENAQPIRDGEFTNDEIFIINQKVQLITTKPMIYLANVSAKDIKRKACKYLPKIKAWIDEHGGGTMIPFSVEFEEEKWGMKDDPEGVAALMKDYAFAHKLPNIIKQGFRQLGLVYFFTAGEPEVRAWPLYQGATAPNAAGVIHTDFERGFIKAEVISWEDYKGIITEPSVAQAKAAGKYRMEGKTYIMQDGDVVHFQFNVTAAAKKK